MALMPVWIILGSLAMFDKPYLHLRSASQVSGVWGLQKMLGSLNYKAAAADAAAAKDDGTS